MESSSVSGKILNIWNSKILKSSHVNFLDFNSQLLQIDCMTISWLKDLLYPKSHSAEISFISCLRIVYEVR